MTCYHCHAPTDNGLALCERCQIAGSVIFEFLPVYFSNLSRWRPGRAGARPVPGSREPVAIGGSGSDQVGRAMDEVGGSVSTWARVLAGDRPIELPVTDDEASEVVALCRLFAENLTSIATLEWCGEFLRQMTEHEVKLRRLTERVAPGWYAGGCRQCGYATYVIPGLTWVTCSNYGCGVTTYARDHLETILDEARGWVARPKALAETVVALVDSELSVPKLYTRIRQWAHQGELVGVRNTARDYVWSESEERLVVGVVEVGQPRYRLGEVLDLVHRAQKSESVKTKAS